MRLCSLAAAAASACALSLGPAPSSFASFDLRYTLALPLADAYEEQALAAAAVGLANRGAPALVALLSATDDAWLAAAVAPGGWLAGAAVRPVSGGAEGLVAAFPPPGGGVVLYDGEVPATSAAAMTLAGSDGLYPIAFRPAAPQSLYARLVAGGPRLPVAVNLAGVFNASGAFQSAKAEVYDWLLRRQLPAGKSDLTLLAYYGDYFCGSRAPYISDPTAYDKFQVSNMDFAVSGRGLFFDLSPWADEAPVDDPRQPLGTDTAMLQRVLAAAAAAAAAPGGLGVVHTTGFVPWQCKYVGQFSPHNHGGVDAEWQAARLTSAYGVFVDADACCIGNMASASFWAHAPVAARYVQRAPPSRAALQAAGLLAADGTVPPGRLYYFFYAGDYDSAAWLYSQFLTHWNDPARGSTPIGWAVDPELALRIPAIFQTMYAQAGANDTIIAGDSGAGYLNPTMLSAAARANVSGLGDGWAAWSAWNAAWLRQFAQTYSGFVITGDAPQMGASDFAEYAAFAPNGMAVQNFPGTTEHLAGNLPVVGQTDIPAGDVAAAAAAIHANVPAPGAASRFHQIRSVLTSPAYLRDVAAAAAAAGPAIAVGPLALGYLQRAAMGGSNDDRVAYVDDSLPPAAPAGSVVAFAATVRNDGWNALAARNHTLVVAVARAARLRGAGARAKLARLLAAHEGARWPANPALARQATRRLGLAEEAADESAGSWAAATSFPFPADLLVGGALAINASVALPAMRDGSGVAYITYGVWATLANGSAVSLQGNGNLPWVAAVVLT